MVPLCWQWVYPSKVQRITYLCGVLSACKQFMPLCCPQMPISPLLAALGTEPRMFTPSSFMVSFWSFATLQYEHKFSFAVFLLWVRLSLCSFVWVVQIACWTWLNSSVRSDKDFGGISFQSLPSVRTHEDITLRHTQAHTCHRELRIAQCCWRSSQSWKKLYLEVKAWFGMSFSLFLLSLRLCSYCKNEDEKNPLEGRVNNNYLPIKLLKS